MHALKILFLIIFTTITYAKPLSINKQTTFYDVLPYSDIYIDKTKKLGLLEIQKKDALFEKNDKTLLGFGHSPNFNVWVRFILTNNSNETIHKILEYDNAIASEVILFEAFNDTLLAKDGLFNINKNRKTINPMFKLELQPNETKTYYIKTSSYITTLIVKLNIWGNDSFYAKEIKHQLILSLFFGAMVILALYNLFLFFFTRDISYFYYILYIVGLIFHHVIYVGFSSIYIFDQESLMTAIKFSPLIVAFPIFALALFSKSFLNIKQYTRLNLVLNIYLFTIPLFLIAIKFNETLHQYRNIFFISLLLYLIGISIYAAIKHNRQAYFVLLGWLSILIAFVFMYLSSAGIFNIYEHYRYLIETSLIFEALIFSIALADRINYLQKDKDLAHKRLLNQQQNEKERLEHTVHEKTKDLKVALDEKGLLLKELNHRVKNNMQTIVSLIRLQHDKIEDKKIKDVFITIQNRINAMSHLHELLYKQESISHVNAYEYFDVLIEELKESYDNEINIEFDIQTELKMEQAIYCGLILNELVSNSFKYAFKDGCGNINISLVKHNNLFILLISDDGVGYNTQKQTNSLGLILVNTLAKHQLKGNIDIDSTDGVTVKIGWESND